MSGAWDAMLEYETRANNPVEAHHQWWLGAGGHGTGKWSQKAFIAGVKWVLERQGGWDALTEREAILELRKGDASVYFPLFADSPRIWADCPQDARVTVGVEGFCDSCGWDWMR